MSDAFNLPIEIPHPVRSNGLLYTAIVVALGAVGFILCYQLAAPFLTPLAVAFVLAILFAPFHRWMVRHVRAPSLAAGVSVIVIAAAAFAILTLLVAQFVREAAVGADLVRTTLESGGLQKFVAAHPKATSFLQKAFQQIDAQGLAADAAAHITSISTSFLRGSIMQIAGTLLTLFLLFYFLRDREVILTALRSFLPFTDPEMERLGRRIVDTVHATVYGVVVTGVLLGLFGGLIFAVVGLPAPLLWGLVMATLAILPAVGIGLVWIPAVFLLALGDEWGRALIVTLAFGALTAADTIAYPYLIGNRMRLHTAVTFIAAIGGLIVFGAVGFILGPLVVAVTISLKEIIQARFLGASIGRVC